MNWSWSKIFEFCCPRRLFLSEGTALARHHFQKQNSMFNLIQCMMKIPSEMVNPPVFVLLGMWGMWNVKFQQEKTCIASQCVSDMFFTSSQRMLR